MTGKVDADATDGSVGLNKNSQEPGETNTNEVHNNQHGAATSKIHILPGNQDDQSTLTPTGNSK